MDINNLPAVLTVAEVAEILRIPKSQIYRRIRNGQFPRIDPRITGRHVRIARDSVLGLLSSSNGSIVAASCDTKLGRR